MVWQLSTWASVRVNGLELLVIPFQISCYLEKSAHLTGFERDDVHIYFGCSSLVLNFIMGVSGGGVCVCSVVGDSTPQLQCRGQTCSFLPPLCGFWELNLGGRASHLAARAFAACLEFSLLVVWIIFSLQLHVWNQILNKWPIFYIDLTLFHIYNWCSAQSEVISSIHSFKYLLITYYELGSNTVVKIKSWSDS